MDDKTLLESRIDDDGLTAWLVMPEDFDRAMLNPGLCDTTLQAGGIELTNTTKQLIEKFIGDATVAPPGAFEAVIARGAPPKHGIDGRVEWLIGQDNATTTPPSEQEGQEAAGGTTEEDEPVSFYDQSIYTIVTAGDKLARIHQPTHGEDGRGVTGKTLAARDGKPAEFKHDETVIVTADHHAIAQADGVLDRSGPTIGIRDTIEVDQYVDFNTGNIAFNGNVLVHKGVRDRFTIEAEQDIEVRGLIEAATIAAGGDLRALGGFAGREQGTASVGGSLHAKYLDAVRARVRGNLRVDNEIINCNTTILGGIDSPNGALIGGESSVAGPVEIGELGAEGQPVTLLRIGVVPHLDPLIDELDGLVVGLTEQRQKLLEEQEMIETTSGMNVMAGHKERLCELMYEIAEVQGHLDRAEPALEQVRERAESMRAVDVCVNKRVYPKTVLDCAGLRYQIRNEIDGPVRITLDGKRQLQIEQQGGEPKMLASKADLSEAA